MDYINIVIALFLAYISWQNNCINKTNSAIQKANLKIQKDKFRLDLFDRRYSIFGSFKKFISVFIRNGNVTYQDLNEFSIGTSDVEFLFGQEIQDYVNDVRKKSFKSIEINRKLGENATSVEDRNKLAGEYQELSIWFGDQYINATSLFRKYLHFSVNKDF